RQRVDLFLVELHAPALGEAPYRRLDPLPGLLDPAMFLREPVAQRIDQRGLAGARGGATHLGEEHALFLLVVLVDLPAKEVRDLARLARKIGERVARTARGERDGQAAQPVDVFEDAGMTVAKDAQAVIQRIRRSFAPSHGSSPQCRVGTRPQRARRTAWGSS